MSVLGPLTIAASAITGMFAQITDGEQQLPPLSVLTEECSIRSGPLGPKVPIGQPSGIWLTCRDVRFLVVRPENLLGKVQLRSSEQALEFVRFFSSISTFALLEAGGCVEVTDDSRQQLFYRVEPRLFSRYFKQPKVEAQGSAARDDLGFVSTRAVVCPDQRVYELTEQVFPDGMYFQTSKKLLLKSASTVGISHLPAY